MTLTTANGPTAQTTAPQKPQTAAMPDPRPVEITEPTD